MTKVSPEVDLLFETSWEVCNKIGGIYTVLSTKAKTLQRLYKDKTIFIGPDVWSEDVPSPYFIESDEVLADWKNQAFLPYGIKVRIGRWDVPGKPIAVLVKFDGLYAAKNEFYGEMWRIFGVDSLHAYGDYDEGCTFAHAAGIVIESICNFIKAAEKNVIAHFDEWTTGMGLLYVKWKLPYVATVFTTHATSIGRSICGNGKPLYDYLQGYNGDQMSRELNMEAKHSLEKTAAREADCFTTVSEITAIECEQLLERRPQVVTPNGFEKNFVPAKSRLVNARKKAKAKLLSIASALTAKEYAEDTFLVATSGRCEYRNKGIDVYIDSLKLLSRLTDKPVVAFIMVPAWLDRPRKDLQDALKKGEAVKSGGKHITHIIHNDDFDPIINRVRLLWPDYAQTNVDVIYVPCYLDGKDGIFNNTYYQLLAGLDATVFPSYYEPWGYTPLESVAFGVPTITTSLSGFGRWILATTDNDVNSCGVVVTNRGDGNYQEVFENIARNLVYILDADRALRDKISKAAFATADRAAWSYFIKYYEEAYELALQNAKNRISENE